MIDSQGGGPGYGQRGQMSSLSINPAIAWSAAVAIRCAASLFVMWAAATFELTADTRNATEKGEMPGRGYLGRFGSGPENKNSVGLWGSLGNHDGRCGSKPDNKN
jgi:hypothetical protein